MVRLLTVKWCRAREWLLRALYRTPALARGRAVARRPLRIPCFAPHIASSDAETRACELLVRMLDASQRKELRRGYFTVDVPGRGKFWIFAWRSLNVVDPRTGDCYCCTPELAIPLGDLMLAQKLLLECDPERFFSLANRQPQFIVSPGSARALIHEC